MLMPRHSLALARSGAGLLCLPLGAFHPEETSGPICGGVYETGLADARASYPSCPRVGSMKPVGRSMKEVGLTQPGYRTLDRASKEGDAPASEASTVPLHATAPRLPRPRDAPLAARRAPALQATANRSPRAGGPRAERFSDSSTSSVAVVCHTGRSRWLVAACAGRSEGRPGCRPRCAPQKARPLHPPRAGDGPLVRPGGSPCSALSPRRAPRSHPLPERRPGCVRAVLQARRRREEGAPARTDARRAAVPRNPAGVSCRCGRHARGRTALVPRLPRLSRGALCTELAAPSSAQFEAHRECRCLGARGVRGRSRWPRKFSRNPALDVAVAWRGPCECASGFGGTAGGNAWVRNVRWCQGRTMLQTRMRKRDRVSRERSWRTQWRLSSSQMASKVQLASFSMPPY